VVLTIRRELEVLEILAAGRSNYAIADNLVVTPRQRQKHVSHVLGKLAAANRTEAVARGARTGPNPLTHRPVAHPEGTFVPGPPPKIHPPCPLSGDARRSASS
jgi:DNA-binding CsgD family transcriptional regulator